MNELNIKYNTAIKNTLIYSSIFKYPLTYYQILNFLIIDEQENINIKIFQQELARLIKKKYIIVKDEMCFLPGVRYLNWHLGRKFSKKIFKKNRHIFKILNKIPWIKFIGATGSSAAKNSNAQSDLDVFIITQKNRVWLTRFFVTIILKTIFKSYVKKGIDPNIYIDETCLSWPTKHRNLYVANEIIRMEPIIDKENYYFKFLNANKWVNHYIGNFKAYYVKQDITKNKNEFFLSFLDTLLMYIQIFYMKKRITSEVVKKNFIHFNKNDSTHPVLNKYQQKIKSI